MTSQPLRAIQIVLLTATCLCMAGIMIVFFVALKYRKNKVMKASSPGLLYVNLFGCLVLYSESIISVMQPTLVLCMMIPCFRLIGFYLTYGPLCFKTWRVAVIMQVVKSRAFSVKDSALYKILSAIICICVLYLLLWGSVDPVPMKSLSDGSGTNDVISQCCYTWWAFVSVIVEVILLLWGIVQCVRSRKAPNLYNDTKITGFIFYNEMMWILFDSTVRYMLLLYPSELLPMLLYFTRTQLTVTLLVALIFGSKFHRIKGCLRELHGTVTDIYGDRKVHRLALIVNKYGDIKNIYCAPCGPLNYTESSMNSSSEKEVTKDTGYTEVEIDRLVNLLSKLKSEKEMYRLQVQQLQRVLRGQIGTAGPARIAPSRIQNGYALRHVDLDCDNEPDIYLEHKDIVNRKKFLENERNARRMDIGAMREDNAYKAGYASTVTTYISSRSDRLTPLSASGSDGTSPEKRKRGSVHNGSNYAKSVFATAINFDSVPIKEHENNPVDRTMWPLVDLKQIGSIPADVPQDDLNMTSPGKQNNAKQQRGYAQNAITRVNSPTSIGSTPQNSAQKLKKKKRRSCDIEFEYIRTNDSDDVDEFPVLVTTARHTQAINLSPRRRMSNGSVPNPYRRDVTTLKPETPGTMSPNDGEFVVDSDKMFIMYI